MVVMGVLHFTHASIFASIVPPSLPAPELLVYISGIAEIALGVMLFVDKTRRLAGYGLIALFLAVFPANVYMAMNPDVVLVGKPAWLSAPPPIVLWARLPLQAVLIYWAWLYAKPSEQRDSRARVSSAQGV